MAGIISVARWLRRAGIEPAIGPFRFPVRGRARVSGRRAGRGNGHAFRRPSRPPRADARRRLGVANPTTGGARNASRDLHPSDAISSAAKVREFQGKPTLWSSSMNVPLPQPRRSGRRTGSYGATFLFGEGERGSMTHERRSHGVPSPSNGLGLSRATFAQRERAAHNGSKRSGGAAQRASCPDRTTRIRAAFWQAGRRGRSRAPHPGRHLRSSRVCSLT